MPSVLGVFTLSLIKTPILGSIGLTVWGLGRVMFAYGYDPRARSNGFFGYFGLLIMLGLTYYLAGGLLRGISPKFLNL